VQRVALAFALVGRPSLLLFDEPLSSLDANLRERLRIEIGTLVREIGASAVYITHDQGEAFALGDQVGVLQDGRLVQHDTPEGVYRRPATAFVARFTGLAGELRGRVLAMSDRDGATRERVRVLLDPAGGARASELLASCTAPLAPGAAVQVLLRPAAVTLCDPTDSSASLRGEVLDSAFRGRGYDHVVKLPDGSLLSEIFASHSHRREQAVGLRIDPDGCLTFPADAAAGPLATASHAAMRAPGQAAPAPASAQTSHNRQDQQVGATP